MYLYTTITTKEFQSIRDCLVFQLKNAHGVDEIQMIMISRLNKNKNVKEGGIKLICFYENQHFTPS